MVRAYRKMPVGAHYGTRSWLLQRLTAVVMLVYVIVMPLCLAMHRSAGFAGWKAFFSMQSVRVGTMLFTAALLYHAWVGMRDLWMDYVKGAGLRLTLQVLTVLALVACGIWAAAILWG